MYIAPQDATLGESEWRTFVEAHPFGHLVASGRDRSIPIVVPTPFVLDATTVRLHLVRANPVFAALAENPRVLLSVAGDWTHIPSSWKALEGEDERLGIPTTYYAAVQFIGTATVLDERRQAHSVAPLLRRQTEFFQPDVDIADPAEVHAKQLGAILGIIIDVDEVRAKFKYGGNVDIDHRRAVADRLDARRGPGDRVAAAHLRRRSGLEGPRQSANPAQT